MTEEEKTTATLPSDVTDFLGMGQERTGGYDTLVRQPSFAGGTDEFNDQTKKERRARFKASADMLFSTDVSKLDDAGASALYQSVTEGLFGLPDEDGSVAFGKRASKDPRQNIDMLRRFVKGDYTLIEDPEYTKWRQMDDEAKFKYALANETTGNMVKSKLKSERGTNPLVTMAAGDMMSAGYAIPWTEEQRQGQEIDRKWREDAIRNTFYDTMDEDQKAAYRADVIGDYEEKLSRRQTLATFLQFAHGLSDRAGYLLAKSFSDGAIDPNIEGLVKPNGDTDERDRVYAAFSLMRGDQKKGRILGIQTDFTDGTWMNRFQLGLYGFQQSVVGLVTDTGKMARDAALWTYAKTAMDEAERKEFFKGWDANVRAEQAMKQNLPEADGVFGEAFQGLAENLHWFIPYSMIGKGGKMVNAARGFKEGENALKGWKKIFQPLKDLKVTLTPMRLGGALKEEKAALEAGKAAMESAAAATRAAWTLDVNGVKKLGDMGSAILTRQMAAVDRYTQMLRGIDADLKAAKWWKDAAGAGMWAAGEASAFSAFASEYIANADAAGISREESVLTAAAIGLINAKIEHFNVLGLDSSLTPAQIKSLTFAAMAQAVKTDGAAGFRKWLANRVSKGVTEGLKTGLTETVVEEPLQQLVMEHGKAFDRMCQELRANGQATYANEMKAFFASLAFTEKDWATFIDTVVDMIPSGMGFAVAAVPGAKLKQHIHNAWTRGANRRAGAEATDTMFALAQRGEDPSGAVDYDAGLVDVIQQAVNVRTAVEKHWQGEEDGGEAKNPHRFEEAITAARRAWRNPKTGDVVQEVADAAGVDVKTAEVLAQYLQTEAEAAAFSPQARAWTSLNMSLADIDEATIKTVLPGYVEGSFASDPENGIYSGRVRMDDGTEKTIAYRVGDIHAELVAEAQNMAKADSSFGKSFDARHAELGDGVTWASLSDAQRYAEAVRSQASVNGFSTGKSGVFELTDSKGEKVRVNADDIIYLANGRIGDIGYGPAATQGTVRHETFHSLWRFVRGTLADADVQQLAKTLGIDVTKDGWEVTLDERMAHEMERYASGHYVSHAVSSRFDKMLDSWAGKIINFFGQFGPSDEVTDPKTGKPYQLKGLYDSILRGELGSGALGVELRKVPARPTPDGVRGEAPSVVKSAMPVEVTDADRAAQEAEMRAEAKEEESPTAPTSPAPTVTPVPPPAPVQAATAENPADASTPNQVYYRVGLPNSPVKLVGRLEVRDASTGVITSTDADYHDRGNQNRDDKSEESRALVEKIGANPDPLQVGTVQPIANNGIVWLLNNSNVIIGNHRVNGVRRAYEKGTAGDLEKFVREDAAKRGIEIGADVKKPLMVFVLERIESPDGKADVHEVVRLANESQNRGFNVREQAGNDAKILADNNLLPRMEFRADGRIDETKSGDAIGKFRQESGAQGLIAEDGSLTEEGQTRIQNAALAVLLGGEGNNALLQKIMSNAGRLDMQSELRALMKMTPELMALGVAKPGYDLRAPLAEALQLFTEWRDKDETARVEKNKTRHDWRETKDGRRVRGLSWEAYLSQGDMFRAPSDEAKILGDLFAKAESLRSFDREDVESAAGKKRVIDLISDYLADYIANARAVNTETDDMFGGSPASRADVLAAQRATGGDGSGPRFSVSMRETLDPAAWGDLSSKVKVAGDGRAPFAFNKGARVKDVKEPLFKAAVENFKRQSNYKEIDGHHYLEIDGSLIELTKSGVKHGLDRRYELNGYAAVLLGDILNNSIEVPNVDAPMHYRIGVMDVGQLYYVLVTTKDSDGIGEVQNVEVLNSVNAKADGTAQGFNLTNAIRPTEVSISNLRAAWQGAFLQNLVKHNIDSVLKDKNAPVARQREAVIEKYKGTAEWLMAPNGVKSNLGEDQWVTVRTPAFKSWFGDWENDSAHASKIVDANGEPLVVYRGAPFDPLAQEPGKGVIKPEAYFTADPKYAGRYGKVRAYYLNIRNPFDVRRPECLADLKKIYPDHEFQRGKSGALDWAEAATVDGEFLRDNFGDKYDGVIYDEGGDPGESGVSYRGISYVPLDGGVQIKSATDNTGAFSENPDIRFSIAEQLPKVPKGTIRLAEVGPYYYAFGKDAEAAAPLLGSSLVSRNGEVMTAFPRDYIDTMLARLIRNGKSAALLSRNADGTFGVRRTVDPGQMRYSLAFGEVGTSNLDDALFIAGNLATARQMLGGRDWEKVKKDERLKIKLATGWEKGADGRWRYEAADIPEIDLARLKKPNPEYKADEEKPKPKYLPVSLADLFTKKAGKAIPLFTAYPWLKNAKIQYGAQIGKTRGQLIAYRDDPHKFTIRISEEQRPDAEGVRKTLIHELQHAIQSIEGFARGGDTDTMERLFLKKFADARDEARGWRERYYATLRKYDSWTAARYASYPRKHPAHIEAAAQIEADPDWAKLEEERKEFRRKWGHDPKYFIDSDWGALRKAVRTGFQDYRKLAGEVEARNAAERTQANAGTLMSDTEDVARKSQIVRFSIASLLDEERRELESKGGKLLLTHHGTQSGRFTVFDQSKNDFGQPGFYFAKDRDTAMTYSSPEHYDEDDDSITPGMAEDGNALYNDKGLYNVALRMERPLEVDAQGAYWHSVPFEGEKQKTREITAKAFERGYDGVVFHNVIDNGPGGFSGYLGPAEVYAVKESNQIKVVDEMTYADDGSIIPAEARLDWSNPDIRYSVSKELTDAMRKREAMQSIPVEGKVQPWPENFPKVVLQTTLASVKQKWPELHQRAKAGSEGAALSLVRNILGEEPTATKKNPKWEKLRTLAAEHPRAIVAYVHAEEATGRNKIPAAYAAMIEMIAGLRNEPRIVQTVRAHHTGANAVERMTRRAAFDGPVRRGAEYILVDDHVTQGGTLNELRKYIQSRGGKIVAISTLTASQFSDTIAISSDAIKALHAKFGNNLDEEIKQAGIANGVAELTQSQARELLKLRADTLRDRLAQARLDRHNELDAQAVRLASASSVVSGATDLLPGLKAYQKPDGTFTETGTRWAKAKQFQRPIGRELNSLIDDCLLAGDMSPEETAATLDRLIAAVEATDEIKNSVLPNFRSDSALDDPTVMPVGPDGKKAFTPERAAIHQRIYDVLMADRITGENNEALETRKDGSAKEEAVIVRANEGRPELPPISLQNPSYETAKEFRIDIIVGPPAAGKSSVFANALSTFYRSRVLDCDAVKKMLPGFNDGNGANYVHAESSMLNKRMIFDIQHRAEDDPRRGENVVLPVLGDDAEGLRRKIADWHAAGYTVYLHNNRVPILHAFGRAVLRTLATGRWINPAVIRVCQDRPTNAYNLVKKESDYYDQFSNDVNLGDSPIWEDGNYADPAYGRNVRRLDEQGMQPSSGQGGLEGRLERNGVKPASVGGQQILPGMEGQVLFSTEAPRSALVYPQLRGMSDDELLSAAIAARIALGKSDKVSDRSVKVTTVQKLMRRLHPDWDTTKIGVESQRVMSGAQKFARRIREDIDRGVSDSLVLEHLPSTMREQFGSEMRQEAREGARIGAFGVRANAALEERQARLVEDAVRVQTGLDAGAIENAFGINLSETIMHLADNPLTEKEKPQGATGTGEGESEDVQAEPGQEEAPSEIDAKVKAVVDDIVSAAGQQAGSDEQNRKNRKAAAGRDAENKAAMGESEENGDEGSVPADTSTGEDGDALAAAVAKEALNLENPRHLARFVAELARRQWIQEHHLAKDAEVWRDLVAVQFLRRTAQSVYSKLVRDLTYSRSRETAMGRIAKLDNVPTVAGLLSEMEFVGALINAQRIRDTQKQLCEKLDLFLRQNFGAQGHFKPDKEEGKRKVSAEAELRARYMRHAMWLTPDAAAEEARQLQKTLDSLSVDFQDAGRDRDQSREFVETIRKLNVLREFGALRHKPVGEIEAAVQWWQDFARGESDDIVREMSDRDIRTKKAAHLLAVAFADPKRTTIREGGKADALNRFITGHMGFISLLQDCMRHTSDADAAAVKDIVDYIAREVQKAGDRSEAEKRRHNDAFHSAVEGIYGKSFNAVMKDMMAPDERFTKYMGVVGGKRVTPTKGRALQLLVSLLQEGRKVQVEDEDKPGQTKTVWEGGYHDNIVKHHREGQAAEIMRFLDPADMNMLKWLGQWYELNRSDLSGVCHSLFGIGVYAEQPNYFPVKMQLETQGLEKGNGVGWTIFPKALTPRVRNERDFDTSADIFSMWASRMEEAAQWKHHAQLGLELRGIFGRSELREAVRANHGTSVDDLMQGFITDILSGHGAYDRSTAGVQYFSDQIRGWTALCALGGNVGVMAKQTTSIPAFGFEIGLVNTARYMVSAFTPEGMAAMRRIWDSEQRKTRWRVGSSEAVRNALNQQGAGALKRMFQASMITNKLGDVVPALVVGQGIYRDCLARGMSEEDAMAETWSLVERTQQSGRMENQTSIQRRNKLGRIMFQFLSTQQQYLQYEVRAIREVIARPDSVKRWGSLGRAILLNHFILSSAYYWMGQLYKYALGQEPPEDELKDWIVTCLLGPYGSLFVAGFCCKYTLERAIKGYSIKGGSSMLPMESWLKNQINDGAKLLEAIFDSDGDTWDNMLDAAGRWMSDSNSTVRDLRKIYRYRVKGEQQKK